jgi:bile acid:Na+ symporter, BASS family
MILLAGISVAVSPVLLELLLMAGFSNAEPLHIDYLKIMTVITLGQLLPLSGGLALNHWKPAVVRRTARPIRILNLLLLLSVCFVVIPIHSHGLMIFGWRAVAGMAVVFFASVFVGWLMGGPGRDQRKALSFNTTLRNIPAAMVVASANFPGRAAIAAVFVYAIFSTLGTLALVFLIRRVRADK